MPAFGAASEPRQEEKKGLCGEPAFVCVCVKLPATELSLANSAFKGLARSLYREARRDLETIRQCLS